MLLYKITDNFCSIIQATIIKNIYKNWDKVCVNQFWYIFVLIVYPNKIFTRYVIRKIVRCDHEICVLF